MDDIFISIQNLEKTYMAKRRPVKRALKGLTLDIMKGEVLGLLGVNGAGKTTLSTILAGLHPATAGTVYKDGKSIHDDIVTYRRHVGFCPQKANLDNMLSMQESLIFAGRCYGLSFDSAKKRSSDLMALFKMGSYAESLPMHLSGGYRQRFLIARTLMHSPEFVILDEPTIGLDPHIRRQLWDVILELKKEGTTVLLTTHYLDEVEALSDRICFIHDGEVKKVDTKKNIMEGHSSLEEVYMKVVGEQENEA